MTYFKLFFFDKLHVQRAEYHWIVQICQATCLAYLILFQGLPPALRRLAW